jgi:hypothetical protein
MARRVGVQSFWSGCAVVVVVVVVVVVHGGGGGGEWRQW